MVAKFWFHSRWRTPRKHETVPGKRVIGILAFEVASLMSKLIHLWQSLSDKQILRTREEIMSSVGIRKLISEDDDYIVGLICAEMIENLAGVARAVARLSINCGDPLFMSFGQAFDDLIKIGADPYRWQFAWKKMDRKVKKMQRFIVVNGSLYQQMEALSDLEQTLRRTKVNDDGGTAVLLEYQKKVAWKQREVRHLKDISLWNRTYDYIVCLCARSLFTIYGRMGHVLGISHVVALGMKDSRVLDSDFIHRGHSLSLLMRPSGNRTNKTNNFYSGPIGNSITKLNPISGRQNTVSFYSGPLPKSATATASVPLPRATKFLARLWQSREKSTSTSTSTLQGTTVGASTGRMIGRIRGADLLGGENDQSILCSKNRILNAAAPPGSLGASALALHYANVIAVIEKLVASPHLIGNDEREDLYNMLPASVRAGLRAKLKPFLKSLGSSVYDTGLAGEWSEAMSGILEWLAPLAHNMIRWQSERSFEHQNLVSRTNVLLVQTLYFASHEKTEATITELLVGLNYIWRSGRELNAKAFLDCASARTFEANSLEF